jgi:elongation factor G
MDARVGSQAVRAFVPLSAMFGYAMDVRSKTQGRANFTMQFDHYERVPTQLAEELISKR